MNKRLIYLINGIVLIFVDQLTKILMINKNFIVIQNFLEINYLQNYGMAFGVGNGSIIKIIFFNVILIGINIYFIEKKESNMDKKILFLLNMILAGGISNLLDRIFRGYVIDFISVKLYKFPVFNIADIVITVSILILIIIILGNCLKSKSKK